MYALSINEGNVRGFVQRFDCWTHNISMLYRVMRWTENSQHCPLVVWIYSSSILKIKGDDKLGKPDCLILPGGIGNKQRTLWTLESQLQGRRSAFWRQTCCWSGLFGEHSRAARAWCTFGLWEMGRSCVHCMLLPLPSSAPLSSAPSESSPV